MTILQMSSPYAYITLHQTVFSDRYAVTIDVIYDMI